MGHSLQLLGHVPQCAPACLRYWSAPSTPEATDTSSQDEEQEKEKEPLVVIPYMGGMSEVCRKFNIRIISDLDRHSPQ